MKLKCGKKTCAYLSLALAETTLLFLLSVLPLIEAVPSPGLARPGDIEHFVVYTVYGFLWTGFFRLYFGQAKKGMPGIFWTMLMPLAIGSLVGASCEALQLIVPTRTADALDWMIDSCGSLAGTAIASGLKKAL